MPNTEVRSTFIRIIVLTNVRLVRKGKRLEDPWDDFFAVHDLLALCSGTRLERLPCIRHVCIMAAWFYFVK